MELVRAYSLARNGNSRMDLLGGTIVDVNIDADSDCTMSTVTAKLKAGAESEAVVEPNVIDTGLNQEVGSYLVSVPYPCQPIYPAAIVTPYSALVTLYPILIVAANAFNRTSQLPLAFVRNHRHPFRHKLSF